MVADVRYGDPRFGQLMRCHCLEASLVAARAQAAAARREALTAQLTAELGRLARCTLETLNLRRPFPPITWGGKSYDAAEQQRQLARAAGFVRGYQPPESLYLYGPPGGAKSHLAAALLHRQAAAGVEGRYGSTPALLRLIQAGFRDGTAAARLAVLMEAELLVLDDLGAENDSPWAVAQLFDLINTRAITGRATVITSNLAPDDHADARIVSRLYGEYTLLPVVVSDFRRLPRQEQPYAA